MAGELRDVAGRKAERELQLRQERPPLQRRPRQPADKVERRRLRETVDEPAEAPSPGSSARPRPPAETRSRPSPGSPHGLGHWTEVERGAGLEPLTDVLAGRIGPCGLG